MAGKQHASKSDVNKLQNDYASKSLMAAKVTACLSEQLTALIDKNGITLGVPLESRVKSWGSIKDKIERQKMALSSLEEMADISGVRLILLFKDDLATMDSLIKNNLDVLSYEDTSTRLESDQFGYQSNHYVVCIPETWSNIPSYSSIKGQRAEIQVRTVAQHIWAAASHKLQYKREDGVPFPLRRSINRISALLETVDLEFTRILQEREAYVSDKVAGYSDLEGLNVDLLARVLSDIFPRDNANTLGEDPYDALLIELADMGITTARELKDALSKNVQKALDEDGYRVSTFNPMENVSDEEDLNDTMERLARGVFYTHVGLARVALNITTMN